VSQPPSPTLPQARAAAASASATASASASRRGQSPYALADAPSRLRRTAGGGGGGESAGGAASARSASSASGGGGAALAAASAAVEAGALALSWLKRASKGGVPYYVNLGTGASVWEAPQGDIYDVGADGVLLRL
jgi:hypothetical protein